MTTGRRRCKCGAGTGGWLGGVRPGGAYAHLAGGVAAAAAGGGIFSVEAMNGW